MTGVVDAELNDAGAGEADYRYVGTTSAMRQLLLLLGLGLLLVVTAASAKDEKSIARFTEAMLEMSPAVDPTEAQQISEIAHRESRRLASEYRMVGFSGFQSFLVNIGAREKGHCFHFAYDIGRKLRELPLRTLELHWGAADPGTQLEHNVLIVTGTGQSIRDGYIIDGWRNSGRLLWKPVKTDSYKWGEDFEETAWLQAGNPLRKINASVPSATPRKAALTRKERAAPR